VLCCDGHVQVNDASLRANELAEVNQQLLSRVETQQGQMQRVSA
jgi:hypothetical protein